MKLRHSFVAALAVAAMTANSVFGIDAIWNGGNGNFTDANWVDGGGLSVTPAAGDNIIIPTGTVQLNSDLAGSVGDYAELRIAGGTLDVTTGGRVSFAGNILLGTDAGQTATLIMQGDSVFSGASFRWASTAGARGDVIIRDTASFSTKATQDIIGFSSALGAGTWTTEGANVTLFSDDDLWVGDDDLWIANITDANAFSTADVDDAFGFVGNGSVQVNLSGFQQQLGQRWRLIESHGETTQGPIANGALPATFTVTGLEPGFGMRIFSEEVSDTLGFLDVELLNVLNLKVDMTTGEAILENPAAGGLPLDVDAYTITSASGSLLAAGFNGLADDGQAGWLPGLGPSQGPNRLSESNFDSSTVINGATATADFDGDGTVTGSDLLTWQANSGRASGAAKSEGDADGDGDVDGDDLAAWEGQFGGGGTSDSYSLGNIFDVSGTQDLAIQFTMTNGLTLGGTIQYVGGAAAAGPVPEPTSLAMATWLVSLGLAAGRRRK
jgi:hypothetical protein